MISPSQKELIFKEGVDVWKILEVQQKLLDFESPKVVVGFPIETQHKEFMFIEGLDVWKILSRNLIKISITKVLGIQKSQSCCRTFNSTWHKELIIIKGVYVWKIFVQKPFLGLKANCIRNNYFYEQCQVDFGKILCKFVESKKSLRL